MYAASPALHVANLTGMVWLRALCLRDPTDAMRLMDLPSACALRFAKLTDQEIDTLCVGLDVALFLPRFDDRSLPGAIAASSLRSSEGRSSELELQNLTYVHALCGTCHRGLGEAVWAYRLNVATAAAYRALSHEQVVVLCRSLDVAAFIPRYCAGEVDRILAKPAGMRALFAAAYETDIETPTNGHLRDAHPAR